MTESDFPIIINSFNQATYLKNMVSQLKGLGYENLMIIDQNSTYPDVLEYLSEISRDVTVINLRDNYGPHWFFSSGFALKMPQFYAYTDCDIYFNADMPQDFAAQISLLTKTLSASRIGLALDISVPQDLIRAEFSINGKIWTIASWESQFWQDKVEIDDIEIFRAPVDTTFAVYNREFMDSIVRRTMGRKRYYSDETNDCYRIAKKFTATHMPWMVYNPIPPEELRYYEETSKADVHDYLEALGS